MEDLGGFYSLNELGFEWLIAKDGSSDQAGVWGMSELKGGGLNWLVQCACVHLPIKLRRGMGTSKQNSDGK